LRETSGNSWFLAKAQRESKGAKSLCVAKWKSAIGSARVRFMTKLLLVIAVLASPLLAMQQDEATGKLGGGDKPVKTSTSTSKVTTNRKTTKTSNAKPFLDWQLLATGDNMKHYYQPASITRTAEGTSRLWIKYLPIDLNRERRTRRSEVRDQAKAQLYDTYASTMCLYEVDCASQKLRPLELIDYDTSGAVINSAKASANSEWYDPVPGSLMDVIRAVVCKK